MVCYVENFVRIFEVLFTGQQVILDHIKGKKSTKRCQVTTDQPRPYKDDYLLHSTIFHIGEDIKD